MVIVSGKKTMVFLGCAYETVSRAAKLVRSMTMQPASSTPDAAGRRRAASAGGSPRKIRSAFLRDHLLAPGQQPGPLTRSTARPSRAGPAARPAGAALMTVAPTVPRQNSL